MRRVVFAFLFSAAAIAAAAPAAAQEGAPFTGGHVDVIVGGDRVQGGGHDDGLLYGVAGGWDFALGSTARAGIEVEAADSSEKECFGGTIRAGDRLCSRAGRDLYVGARLGALVGPRTLVYAKAGYTNARFKVRYNSGLSTGSYSDAANLDGLRLGAGVEHMLGEHASVKAEYRYSNYEAGAERHQVVLGFGYRF